jgi:DNA invertase Pin-like site-specific DNA recombinase
VAENTERLQRQYALAESAQAMDFASVVVIDDDLGRSGSGLAERPRFQKLVDLVCGGSIEAVFCAPPV